MEILNNPVDPLASDKLYEVVCRTCSADIRFVRSEALSETENITAFLLTIECPVCHNTVTKTLNKKIEEQLSDIEQFNHLPF